MSILEYMTTLPEQDTEPAEFTIQPLNYAHCIATTVADKQCSRRPCNDSHYCSVHKKIFLVSQAG